MSMLIPLLALDFKEKETLYELEISLGQLAAQVWLQVHICIGNDFCEFITASLQKTRE